MNSPLPEMLEMFLPYFAVKEDKTRTRIVLACKQRFIREGFSKVTIGELCHDLHISKKTFYKHFNDKEDLVLAIMASNLKIFLPLIMDIFESEDRPDKRLLRFLNFIATVFPKNLSVAFMADVQTLIPEAWHAIDEFRKAQIARIEGLVAQGQKAGVFNPKLDPEKFARFFMLLATRVLDPMILYEAKLQLEDITGIWSELIQSGLMTGSALKEEE